MAQAQFPQMKTKPFTLNKILRSALRRKSGSGHDIKRLYCRTYVSASSWTPTRYGHVSFPEECIFVRLTAHLRDFARLPKHGKLWIEYKALVKISRISKARQRHAVNKALP